MTTPPPAAERELREALLRAAEEEVAEHGSASVSLRAVARRAGVSHAAPAYHFVDKAGLLTALAIRGYQRLAASMREAIATGDGQAPARELQAAGLGYVRFALAHPGLFDVMWRSSVLHRDDPELEQHADAAFDVLLEAIGAAQARGWAAGRDATHLALVAWSWVHGFATLWLAGPLCELAEGGSVEDLAAATGGLLIEALAGAGP